MYTKKPFEELDVIDDFLMNAVATDAEVGELFCRKLLSVLLQREVGKIRMDVEVEELIGMDEEENSILNLFDIEPHKQDSQPLPRRNRFYQAKIDGRYLKSGEIDFGTLPNLFIITITNYDPFGEDYMMYTIRNRCDELPELPYDDGLRFVYFNTKGTKGGNRDIRNLLTYIQNSKTCSVTDEATREVHEYVSRVRVQPEVRLEYMKFDEIIEYERLDEKKDGIMELLEEYGTIPEALQEKIEKEMSRTVLKKWLKLAAKVNTIEEFVNQM